jgi:hypothetical protein
MNVHMTLQSIKAAIEKLPRPDRAALTAWLADQEEQEWDEQIRADHRAGKLNALIDRAEKEFDEGTIREAPVVF